MLRRVLSPDVPTPPPAPGRSVGKKAKRDDDDWDQDKPTVKRQMLCRHTSPDTDSDQDDDDDSGNFQPSRRPAAKQRKQRRAPAPSSSRHPPKAPQATVAKTTRKVHTLVVSRAAPIARGHAGTPLCTATVKATHARQEWQWLEEGVISREEADWHFNVFGGKERGYICPNGKCPTTFTRYDALKRHMDNGTCKWPLLDPGWDRLDKRQRKAKIKEASNNKYDALVAERDAAADLRRTASSG
ncbi:hypothetical protein JB92DRAFT_3137063 [Gautieria morchelliformis]|nr:hypothetical protein JB92DRAFT_3137063 [Gautieria morchelliformis]